ncbi:hypothetical protein NA57DRAFT_53127 [Rhizodiscina lignyota]|uniref:Uncharacterized protein n=1 Tax=Rhizodiscina lignyota TaxID=1504668 RepID=A0A9P4IPH8_9PEZI|nr:hypothetical protein NA57DRAFT_53127 [Rhizodiscina lignyota]
MLFTTLVFSQWICPLFLFSLLITAAPQVKKSSNTTISGSDIRIANTSGLSKSVFPGTGVVGAVETAESILKSKSVTSKSSRGPDAGEHPPGSSKKALSHGSATDSRSSSNASTRERTSRRLETGSSNERKTTTKSSPFVSARKSTIKSDKPNERISKTKGLSVEPTLTNSKNTTSSGGLVGVMVVHSTVVTSVKGKTRTETKDFISASGTLIPLLVTTQINPTGSIARSSAKDIQSQLSGLPPLIGAWVKKPSTTLTPKVEKSIEEAKNKLVRLFGEVGGSNHPPETKCSGGNLLTSLLKATSCAIQQLQILGGNVKNNLTNRVKLGLPVLQGLTGNPPGKPSNPKPSRHPKHPSSNGNRPSSEHPSKTSERSSHTLKRSSSVSEASSSRPTSSCLETETATQCRVICDATIIGSSRVPMTLGAKSASTAASCSTTCFHTVTGCNVVGTTTTTSAVEACTPNTYIPLAKFGPPPRNGIATGDGDDEYMPDPDFYPSGWNTTIPGSDKLRLLALPSKTTISHPHSTPSSSEKKASSTTRENLSSSAKKTSRFTSKRPAKSSSELPSKTSSKTTPSSSEKMVSGTPRESLRPSAKKTSRFTSKHPPKSSSKLPSKVSSKTISNSSEKASSTPRESSPAMKTSRSISEQPRKSSSKLPSKVSSKTISSSSEKASSTPRESSPAMKTSRSISEQPRKSSYMPQSKISPKTSTTSPKETGTRIETSSALIRKTSSSPGRETSNPQHTHSKSIPIALSDATPTLTSFNPTVSNNQVTSVGCEVRLGKFDVNGRPVAQTPSNFITLSGKDLSLVSSKASAFCAPTVLISSSAFPTLSQPGEAFSFIFSKYEPVWDESWTEDWSLNLFWGWNPDPWCKNYPAYRPSQPVEAPPNTRITGGNGVDFFCWSAFNEIFQTCNSRDGSSSGGSFFQGCTTFGWEAFNGLVKRGTGNSSAEDHGTLHQDEQRRRALIQARAPPKPRQKYLWQPNNDDLWTEMVSRGRTLWDRLNSALNSNGPDRAIMDPAPAYRSPVERIKGATAGKPLLFEYAMNTMLFTHRGYLGIDYEEPDFNVVKLEWPRTGDQKAWFYNQVSFRTGTIIVNSIQRYDSEHGPIQEWNKDHTEKMQQAVAYNQYIKQTYTAPHYWADVAWYSWYTEATDGCGGDSEQEKAFLSSRLRSLRQVIQQQVTNKLTRMAIQYVWAQLGIGPENVQQYTWVTPENGDLFFGLLGSPNGLGVAHLLRQHHNELGKKTISHISITTVDNTGEVTLTDSPEQQQEDAWPFYLIFNLVDV